MKTETIYSTKMNICNILELRPGARPMTIWMHGAVERHTGRRLFRFIPLPDRYAWSMRMEAEPAQEKRVHASVTFPLNDNALSFESRKLLAAARLDMERLLRSKCRDFERKECHGCRG